MLIHHSTVLPLPIIDIFFALDTQLSVHLDVQILGWVYTRVQPILKFAQNLGVGLYFHQYGTCMKIIFQSNYSVFKTRNCYHWCQRHTINFYFFTLISNQCSFNVGFEIACWWSDIKDCSQACYFQCQAISHIVIPWWGQKGSQIFFDCLCKEKKIPPHFILKSGRIMYIFLLGLRTKY